MTRQSSSPEMVRVCTQDDLRRLVDAVWLHATESAHYPSAKTADMLISAASLMPDAPTGGDWHDGYREGMRDKRAIDAAFSPTRCSAGSETPSPLHDAVVAYLTFLRKSVNVGPLTKNPSKEAALLRRIMELTSFEPQKDAQ